ncbi:MAG: DUF4012 domain-containing protein [Candidatus Moranbacteria bacterium]|nr:DUF4012 domain-containing protein [Candidatus Moranbacteria bacterium]
MNQIRNKNFKISYKKVLRLILVIWFLFLGIYLLVVVFRAFNQKDEITESGYEAYQSLNAAKAGIMDQDLETAQQNFSKAYTDFLQTGQKLDEVDGQLDALIKYLPGFSKIESGKRLAVVGQEVSLAGEEMTQTIKLILNNKEYVKQNLVLAGFGSGGSVDEEFSLGQMIVELKDRLMRISGHLSKANENLAQVDLEDIPKAQRDQLSELKKILPVLARNLEQSLSYADLILELAGMNGSRKYLILFQNNYEMRATGGFIGSYGIVKVNYGMVENIKIDGIYNPDGQLKVDVVPPQPLWKITGHWSMRDANWWPNFPTSARKISWFYEKTGGPSVDGVIAVTPKIIRDLLEVTGPIELEGYSETETLLIDGDNFMDQIQQYVEVDYDKKENRPKRILVDMAPLLMKKVFEVKPAKWPLFFDVLSASLEGGHILSYFYDEEIQSLISEMGWSGEIKDTKRDYLSVINSNIGAKKTDGVIKQKIIHKARIEKDGTVINELEIVRLNSGGFREKNWFNVDNVSWMRIYVPQGSQLIKAEGFTREFNAPPFDYANSDFVYDENIKEQEENTIIHRQSTTRIYEEEGKTVFANWVHVPPGQKVSVKLKYILPYRLELNDFENPVDHYSLLVQKQAGDENTAIESYLYGFNDKEYVYYYPDDLDINKEGWQFKNKLDRDWFLALIFKPYDEN